MAASRRGLPWGLSSSGRGMTTSSASHTWKALPWLMANPGDMWWWVGDMGLRSLALSAGSSAGPITQSRDLERGTR